MTGDLPPCDADLVLQAVPAVQAEPPRLLSDVTSSGAGTGKAAQARARPAGRDEEADLEAAMMLSLAETSGPDGGPANIDSAQLARVMEMQRQGNWETNTASEDEMMARALRLSEEQQQQQFQHSGPSEEDEIQAAIALSLEAGGPRSGGQVGVSQEGGGWGSRLREQEVEEEERWLEEQERARQEEEDQLRQALEMSMETETAVAGSKKEKTKAEVDPVHTAWPKIKNPQPGSLAAGGPSLSSPPPQTSASTSTSAPRTTAAPAPAPASSRVAAPAIPEGEGHRLGEAGGARRGGEAQPRAEDPQEIRRRRMAFLDKLQKSPPSENK